LLKQDKPVILHVINSLGMGGAELLLKNTLPLLEAYEHIICYLGGSEELKESFSTYPVHCLQHSSRLHFLRSIRRLRKIIKQNNISVIHAHLFDSTLIARLACPDKVKLVFTIHNLLSKDAFEVNRLSLWAEKITYTKRQTVIGVSDGVLKDYNAQVGLKGPSHVIYNYISDIFFNIELKQRPALQNGIRLVAVGNLRRQKNYENLLKAISIIKDFPVSLDIYGSGDLQDALQHFINDHTLNVSLKGRTGDVASVLPNYDAYIMPSLFEGYGIAPMEAMAAGMPVLLSDIPVLREVAGESPLYFDPLNPQSIADAIKEALQNRNQLIQRSTGNRSRVKEKASKEIYKQKLESIYRSVLSGNS
jgi:glycosyltransferase involved in cell wall biosynthesis